MEADGHDSVRGKEGFFYSVTVMHVNVNIENSLVVLQQLQNCKNNVVHIAEALCLLLLGVVQPSCPVDAKVRATMVKLDGGINRTSARNLRKFKKARKPRAIVFPDIVPLKLTARNLLTWYLASWNNRVQQIWGNSLQMVDVVLSMKDGHLLV